jgi:uncharacterized protein (TIGR00369 family)
MTDMIMKDFETFYKNMVQFDRYLGMNLSVHAPGKISYELAIQAHHLSAPDSLHGGVTAAMMDATMGISALSYAVTKGNLCATVEFKINYITQGRPGTILVSSGKIKHAGERIIVSEGDIFEKQSGKLIATGLGTFSQYPMKKRPDININNKGKSLDFEKLKE